MIYCLTKINLVECHILTIVEEKVE